MNDKEKIEEAKRLYKSANADQRYVLESLFPELRESEDERIRKEILEFVTIVADSKSNKMEWIAWLEKQGQAKESQIPQHENKTCKENGNSLTNEDERMIRRIIESLQRYMPTDELCEEQEMVDWLEKQGEQKPKWTDSDEESFQHAILAIKRSQFHTQEDKDELVDWLKNIKQRMEE